MCTNALICIFEQIENLGGHILGKFKKDIFVGREKFNRGNGLYFNIFIYISSDKISTLFNRNSKRKVRVQILYLASRTFSVSFHHVHC